MPKKIVITGGLGYIGTELCKIHSGETRFKDITVIDSKFVSKRVTQLRDWGITFKQGHLLDKKFMKELNEELLSFIGVNTPIHFIF